MPASPPIPLFERLLIESHSFCNRVCWFCPRTYDRSGKYLDHSGRPIVERMPTEKVLALLDEAVALGFDGPVGFHHYSEPLLDGRHLTLAREARKRGMKPDLHTNGDPLRDDASLCGKVAQAYDTIVVGLYDYRTDDELAEAFAVARGITIPSELRAALAEDGRDLLGRFREQVPHRDPVRIQRWSARRIALSVGVLLLAAIAVGTLLAGMADVGLV